MDGLNLRDDLRVIRKFMEQSVPRFVQQHPGKRLTGLEIFFSMNNGFLEAIYWTNPDYVPFYYDCLKATFLDKLTLEHWEKFHERWFEEPTQSSDLDLSLLETTPVPSRIGGRAAQGGVQVMRAVGNMLVDMLQACRQHGLFAACSSNGLPRFGVQADDEFHWEEDEIG